MFTPNEKHEVHRKVLEYDHSRFLIAETSALNRFSSQIYINLHKEDCVISLLKSYFE